LARTTIGKAITQFVTDYNAAQTAIDNDTAVSTNSSGDVTAGPLTGDLQTEQLNSSLRSLANAVVTGISGKVTSLNDLGFASNSENDSLSTSDTASLDSALSNNLSSVAAMFTNPTTGLAAQFSSLLNGAIGTNGTLVTEQATLTTQSKGITTQISNIETQVQSYQAQLTNEFVDMETAEEQTNQDASYLTREFPVSSS
jgi:flagellar hook-associated protein 2